MTFLSHRSFGVEPTSFQGAVVLVSGEVATGQIYFPSFELIFVITEEERLALPISKISQLRFYDHEANVNRKFKTYWDDLEQRRLLFEVVSFGEIDILRKPKSSLQSQSKLDHGDYQYFFATNDIVQDFSNFRSKLLPIIKDDMGDAADRFLREHGLNVQKEADIIRIIQHYNQSRRSSVLIADLQ